MPDLLTPTAALLAGLALGLPAGLSPGPMTALVLSQTLRHGLGEGLKVAVTPLLTDGPLLVLSAALAGALAGGPWLGALSLVGSVFLLWLAWETARAPAPEAATGDARPRTWTKAVATNLLNPHPWVFWLTIGGPTVARAGSWSAAAAFALAFLGSLVACKAVLATVTSRWRGALGGPAWRAVMVVLGLGLAAFAVWFGADGYARLTT